MPIKLAYSRWTTKVDPSGATTRRNTINKFTKPPFNLDLAYLVHDVPAAASCLVVVNAAQTVLDAMDDSADPDFQWLPWVIAGDVDPVVVRTRWRNNADRPLSDFWTGPQLANARTKLGSLGLDTTGFTAASTIREVIERMLGTTLPGEAFETTIAWIRSTT